MSFFVTKADGAYSLTTAGYVAVAVILVALIVVAALFAKREKKEKENWNKTACRMCDGSCTCDGDIDVKDLFFSIWWIGNIIQHVVYLFCWLFIWTGDGDADWGGIRGTSASDRTIYLFPTSSTCRLSARIRGTRTFRMFQQIQTWSCKRILVWCSCKICICGNFRMALFWRICVGRLGSASIFACI